MAPKRRVSPLLVLVLLAGACIPCTGIVAAVAVPGFIGYVRRAKTLEAQANLPLIARGIAASCADAHVLPPALPLTPSVIGGTQKQVWPADAAPGWSAIGFAPAEPLYYSYEYQPGPSGTDFVVRARGDLDGDGVESLFELRGELDPTSGELVGSELEVVNELE